ncbi:MAG: J domain-containing protein [Burkholderiaceae bacterium]|nr:J domain-containing protein [Burkholderiaceae bacterium]
MNHYDRLKVTQDAPLEVIRAAYRALAGKQHPDHRPGEVDGHDPQMHEQMAKLNAAYEALSDPESRAKYDAALIVDAIAIDSQLGLDTAESHFDMAWLSASSPVPKASLRRERRVWLIGGVAAVVLVAVTVWATWEVVSRNAMEKALSDQYKARPAPTLADEALDLTSLPAKTGLPTPALDDHTRRPAATAHQPTVDELSRMSDEQLLKALPSLDEAPPPHLSKSSQGRALLVARHPLDGSPLSLRNDKTLVDPLAPEHTRP